MKHVPAIKAPSLDFTPGTLEPRLYISSSWLRKHNSWGWQYQEPPLPWKQRIMAFFNRVGDVFRDNP